MCIEHNISLRKVSRSGFPGRNVLSSNVYCVVLYNFVYFK